MGKEILISVIIPAYNAAENLRACLDSVLAQSYPHFEILLVNDGSADETPTICDEYALIDPRLRVFHKANGGVGSARNMGLDHAGGDYICFVDSDDWIAADYLEQFLLHRETSKALVFFNHFVDRRNEITRKFTYKNVRFSREEFSEIFTYLNFLRIGFICSKFFSASIIREHSIRFDQDIHYAEDLLFILQYLEHAELVKYADYAGYHYRHYNPDSLSKTHNSFASEYKGFLSLKAELDKIKGMWSLSTEARQYIHLWLGKFFLRSLQSFYRGARPVVRSERLALLQEAHRPENVAYLRGLGPLRLPATIRISLALYRGRMFGLYDQYMSVLFKYHRFKLAKR